MGTLHFFQPTAFFLRQDIRSARTAKAVAKLALDMIDEMARLHLWTRQHGVTVPSIRVEGGKISLEPLPEFYRALVRATKSKHDMVDLALRMVTRYEEQREWVRDQGLIPPKWIFSQRQRRSRKRAEQLADVVPFPIPMLDESSETGA